jgi:hypothetical protein
VFGVFGDDGAAKLCVRFFVSFGSGDDETVMIVSGMRRRRKHCFLVPRP